MLLSAPFFMAPSPAWALVDFDSFAVKRQVLRDTKKEFKDRVDLRGTFTLGRGRNGIDPLKDPVMVALEGGDGGG